MAVDEKCKIQLIQSFKEKISEASLFLGDGAKLMALNMLEKFIGTIPETEYDISLSDFLSIHPEVCAQFPQAVSSIPNCAYQYTMGELIECLYDIRDQI